MPMGSRIPSQSKTVSQALDSSSASRAAVRVDGPGKATASLLVSRFARPNMIRFPIMGAKNANNIGLTTYSGSNDFRHNRSMQAKTMARDRNHILRRNLFRIESSRTEAINSGPTRAPKNMFRRDNCLFVCQSQRAVCRIIRRMGKKKNPSDIDRWSKK